MVLRVVVLQGGRTILRNSRNNLQGYMVFQPRNQHLKSYVLFSDQIQKQIPKDNGDTQAYLTLNPSVALERLV
jgi:hypothetical protein